MINRKQPLRKYGYIFIALMLCLISINQLWINKPLAQTAENSDSTSESSPEGSFEDSLLSTEPQDNSQTVPETLLASLPTLQQAQGAFIVDGENGQILFQQTEEELVEIASLTKLLTIYLVYEALEAGEISLEDEVWVSEQAYAISQDYDLPNVPLRQDIPYKIEDLIEAVGVASANGASLVLAEHLAGSESAFIDRMETQLNEWQLGNYQIQNVTGLTNRYSPEEAESNHTGQTNSFDALTVATIAHHLISKYPAYLEYTQIPQKLFQAKTSDRFEMNNQNLMIENADSNLAAPSVDGLMITSSAEDGFSLVVTAERNGFRAIVICLGIETDELAYQEAQLLIDYAFSTYRSEEIITQDMEVTQVSQIAVENGSQAQAPLTYNQTLNLVVPIIDTAPRLVYEFQAIPSLEEAGYLTAPLKAGSKVGEVQIDVAGYDLPILPTGTGNTVPVVIAENIDQVSQPVQLWRSFTRSMSNTWNQTRRFFTDLFN